MKLQNIKALTAQFPEIKSLVQGVNPEHLVIHVEPLDRNALYREIVSVPTVIYDSARPHEEGLYEERVYRSERPDGLYVLVPSHGNRERPVRKSGEFLRHVADMENPCPRIVVFRQTVWFGTSEQQLPVGSGPKTGKEVRIDIYKPPKSGISNLLEEANVSKNIRLTKGAIELLNAFARGYPSVGSMGNDLLRMRTAVARIYSLAKEFQFGAYLHGLREAVRSARAPKTLGKVGDYSVSVERIRNEASVSVEWNDILVTFVVPDVEADNPKISVSNADFTLDEAANLTQGFVKAWKSLYKPIPQPAMFDVLRPENTAPMP